MGFGGKGGGGGGDVFPGNVREAKELTRLQEEALGRASQRSAELNFFDKISPFGSQTFTGTPGEEGFQQITALPGQEQQLLDRSRALRLGLQGFAQQQLPQLAGTFGSPIDQASITDSAGELERATFERGRNLLQPGFDRDQERLQNQLLQRGLPRSSEASEEEFRDLGQQQDLQLENLALSSVGAGRQEQSRLQQAEQARRAGSLQELSALGLPAPNVPQFGPTPQIGQQAADPQASFGQLNANLNTENQAKSQEKQSGIGGLSSIAGAAIMAGMFACSRAFKTDNEPMEPILEKVGELAVDRWRYHGHETGHIGPYAEDFAQLFGVGDGFVIDPVDAFGVCLQAIKELGAEARALRAEVREMKGAANAD